MTIPTDKQARHDLYWRGYRYGKALAYHQHLENHEATLRLELDLAGATKWRARALGELRGYRQART
jgi:hypothetical protein